MQATTLRTFFACQINDKNLARIEKLIFELKKRTPDAVKWVNPRNIHLTIKFLGEFKRTDVDRVKPLLIQSLADFKPFPIAIRDLGAFPSIGKPQTIWLGMQADPALMELVNTLEERCAALGYAREKRPFAAHITLGRLRPSTTSGNQKAIADVLHINQNLDIGQQSVDALYFYQSELTPKGPIYKTLFSIPFNHG
ncbi:MAG: 2,3-cyclic 3-phosphodiesterase [Chloroflexota bacterium]|nr:2,3-cyclic 3-phosphodiesterase [Chloroflexota bacterium]